METLDFQVQHADFYCTEPVAVEACEGVEAVRNHDWPANWREFEKRCLDGEDCCPPGTFLRKPDDSFLHVYQQDANQFQLLMTIPVRKKFLALITYTSWPEFKHQAPTVEDLLEHIRAFATKPNDWLLDNLM